NSGPAGNNKASCHLPSISIFRLSKGGLAPICLNFDLLTCIAVYIRRTSDFGNPISSPFGRSRDEGYKKTKFDVRII
ncbi:MAG: hypothetical protein ACU833_14220, partial [Gammaproteobacteria bacterium]